MLTCTSSRITDSHSGVRWHVWSSPEISSVTRHPWSVRCICTLACQLAHDIAVVGLLLLVYRLGPFMAYSIVCSVRHWGDSCSGLVGASGKPSVGIIAYPFPPKINAPQLAHRR